MWEFQETIGCELVMRPRTEQLTVKRTSKFRKGISRALQPGAWTKRIRHLDSRARWVRVAWLLATLRPPHNYVACDVGVKVISLQTHTVDDGSLMGRRLDVMVITTRRQVYAWNETLLYMSVLRSLCLACPRARWPVPSAHCCACRHYAQSLFSVPPGTMAGPEH